MTYSVNVISFTFRVPEGTGGFSSIICLTAAAESVGSVPVNVFIDGFQVTATKKFLYKKNPAITSVHPLCSLQRWNTDFVLLIDLRQHYNEVVLTVEMME